MDKIKFIMLENDKFSMAVNYSDIVAIQNKNKNRGNNEITSYNILMYFSKLISY